MSQPLDDLVGAAARIEHGDYSARVEERGPPQTRSLARAFNQMSARLATVDTERRTFLAEMAHELRTPLTVLQGQLEAVADGVYPADAEHIAPLLDQTVALERLVDDLRTVALADAGALALARKPTDLGALIEEQLEAFRASATGAHARRPRSSRGFRWSTSMPAGSPRWSATCCRTRSATRRRADAWSSRHASTDRTVSVEVRDSGTGISPELLPRVFDRFVKGSGPSGSGLGLAIAHDLVVAHGGTITAESTLGQGTTIRFTLPIASAFAADVVQR